MNTTTPDAAELAAFTIQARAALAEAVRRDRLYGEALALGFEPGPARQIAALAVETEKQTGLDPSAYILGTANMLAAESPTAHDLARLGWNYSNVFYIACTWACNACRHAVKFAQRVLLRR